MKELDEFKKKKIEEYIDLNKMFLSLLINKDYNEKTISMLKQNHSLMRIALQEIGVVFNEKDTIKMLNEKLLDLEKNQNMTEINYNKISAYVENLKSKISENLSNIGLNNQVTVSFSPNIIISVEIFSSSNRERDPNFYNNEKDYNEANLKKKEKHEKFINNFTCEKDSDRESYSLLFQEKNIDVITKKVEETIGLINDNVEVEVNTRFTLNKDKKIKNNIPALNKIKISFYTLEKDKRLVAAFSSFR